MTGKMVEHFTGEQLFKDWVALVHSTYRMPDATPPVWAGIHPAVQEGWEALAIRLNTKIHAGTTTAIDPAAYLKARGLTVDADAQDTYTDADAGGPGFTTLTLGSDGVSLT